MKVISLTDVVQAGRRINCPRNGFVSYRYLVASDGMGFSLHRTYIPEGQAQHWHYKNHLEACLCISGYGVLTNLRTGERHNITEGVCYALDDHDDHTFQALTDTVLISVFNPPVTGREVHREDGSYAAA